MKIARYFMCCEWEDVGVRGFQPLWVPKSSNFNPSQTIGVVHDMLEHRLCDRGLLHEEAMALGRLVHVRIATGVLTSPERSLGLELAENFDRVQEVIQDVEEIPFVDDFSQACIKKCLDGMRAADVGLDEVALVRTANWMRIGYIDARRRYPDPDLVANAFHWADQNAKLFQRLAEEEENFDTVVRFCWDVSKADMTYRIYRPHFPQWLNNRISNWKNT